MIPLLQTVEDSQVVRDSIMVSMNVAKIESMGKLFNGANAG